MIVEPKHLPKELKAPDYNPPLNVDERNRIGLAVESMRRHMTDEGWQIFDGLQYAGYDLWGYNLPPRESTYIPIILSKSNPSVCVVQDKREWDVPLGNFRESRAKFFNTEVLAGRTDIFKVTILKDSHQKPEYHAEAAQEIGCHAWIVYYKPSVVKGLSGFVRSQHLIRTYHTIDPILVPEYTAERRGCLLSGAVSNAYPLRRLLFDNIRRLYDTTALRHPGYHRSGCATPSFLKLLSQFKVAICTASIFKYALRKMIEATAAGCVVITDLPEDDQLPEIDANLYRVPPNTSVEFMSQLVRRLINEYNPERQKYYADCAKTYYDYHEECKRLAYKLEELRRRYNG